MGLRIIRSRLLPVRTLTALLMVTPSRPTAFTSTSWSPTQSPALALNTGQAGAAALAVPAVGVSPRAAPPSPRALSGDSPPAPVVIRRCLCWAFGGFQAPRRHTDPLRDSEPLTPSTLISKGRSSAWPFMLLTAPASLTQPD
uniref:Secreted protein n=1 Tax=Paramormyrops kingsleyae TaxID=1676925 RepID=A0A3B3SP43_9TELE